MNKKIFKIIIPILLFIFPISHVIAACGNYDEHITKYDEYKNTLSTLDCSDTTDEKTVISCNDIKLEKNLIVEELMKAKEENMICESQETKVDEIIEENKENCSKIFDDDFSEFVNRAMLIFYILGPILLILFGSLDYAKAVVATNEAEIKKAHQRFFKRMVATILIFLAPAITNFILSINMSDYYLSGNAYSCNYEYKMYSKKWSIKYTPTKAKKKGKKSGTHYENMIYKGGVFPLPFAHDSVVMTSTYGWRMLNGSSNFHGGIDLVEISNEEVDILAVADGDVSISSGGCSVGDHSCGWGYGNWVEITHQINGETIMTRYAHMKYTPEVEAGTKITAGTKIGVMGNTGDSYGAHLHFEVRPNGERTDPLPYLNSNTNIATQVYW